MQAVRLEELSGKRSAAGRADADLTVVNPVAVRLHRRTSGGAHAPARVEHHEQRRRRDDSSE